MPRYFSHSHTGTLETTIDCSSRENTGWLASRGPCVLLSEAGCSATFKGNSARWRELHHSFLSCHVSAPEAIIDTSSKGLLVQSYPGTVSKIACSRAPCVVQSALVYYPLQRHYGPLNGILSSRGLFNPLERKTRHRGSKEEMIGHVRVSYYSVATEFLKCMLLSLMQRL